MEKPPPIDMPPLSSPCAAVEWLSPMNKPLVAAGANDNPSPTLVW